MTICPAPRPVVTPRRTSPLPLHGSASAGLVPTPQPLRAARPLNSARFRQLCVGLTNAWAPRARSPRRMIEGLLAGGGDSGLSDFTELPAAPASEAGLARATREFVCGLAGRRVR